MTPRVASSRLVGRSGELAELEAALADAAEGRPSVAFVAGESGVGKSRLLAELMQRARVGGALVLAGEAVDFRGESELAYLPLVAALRPLARSGALSEPLRAAVAPLLPGLAPVDGEGSQARLFEGLLSLLDALGREQPILLVIEDLHWADRSTRAALAFLARSLREERVLVVVSYRPDELLRGHPLRPLLVELERDPRSRRVALDPLTRDELAAQLADIVGAPPEAELLERLWTRSGGNPLFSEELLAAGLDGRGAAPDTLRDALMLRVERLSASARELLGLVAVAQWIDDPLLAETSGLEPRALRDALREAVDAHILVVGDDGAYRFRHALLREVVEADLLPGERGALHLVVARALEARLDHGAGAQATAAVAHHYAAAGDRPAALATAVRAATAAERVYAHGEAAALLDRALALWDEVPDAESLAGADRVALLIRAADAASALGDPGRQLDRLEAAFAGLGPQPDPRRAARILEFTARAQRHLNRAREGIATLERALELIGQHPEDPSPRAEILAGLARSRVLVGLFAAAAVTAREALEIAQAADLPLLEGHARNTLGCSLAMAGDADAGLVELRHAIRIAREHDNLSDVGEAYNNYSWMLHLLGRSEEARAAALEGRGAVAGRRPIAVIWLDESLAEIAFDTGDWEEAETRVPAVQPWTGSQSQIGIGMRRAWLAAGRGDHAAAATLLREIEPIGAASSHAQVLASLGMLTAELRQREGDLDAARAAVEEWFERLDRSGDDTIRAAALAAAGVTVEADAAERARDLGDEEAEDAARRRIGDLMARIERPVWDAEPLSSRTAAAASGAQGATGQRGALSSPRPVEHATLLGARAEAGRAAGRPDPEAYARAAAAWDAVGRPEPAARMRWRQAEALAAAGRREAAAEAARAAHATAVRIGAGWLRAQVEGLAARARLMLELPPDETEPPAEDPFGLTERERQVLALVIGGATNREIGETLFMAERTASVHVSRILTKLNVRSRTEAAGVAIRHRLTDRL